MVFLRHTEAKQNEMMYYNFCRFLSQLKGVDFHKKSGLHSLTLPLRSVDAPDKLEVTHKQIRG